MEAGGWLKLDMALGYAEFALVILSLAYLGLALAVPGRARARRALVLAALTAVTVAQPFGVKGEPISPTQFSAGNPKRLDAERVHNIGPFGFRPYTGEIRYLNGEGGYPTDWLKLRSWLWPGLLTNGTKLERMCGSLSQPCWEPSDVGGRSDNLELIEAGGELRYRILTYENEPPRYPGPTDSVYRYGGYYSLGLGVVSLRGLAYWLVAAALGAAVVMRNRRVLVPA